MSTVYQYARKGDRSRVGVMLAYHNVDTNDLFIGWSKKHRLDKKFDREKGLKIALERALAMSKTTIPAYVHKQLYRFIAKMEEKFQAQAKAAPESCMQKIIDQSRQMAFVFGGEYKREHTETITICKHCGKEIKCPSKEAGSVN